MSTIETKLLQADKIVTANGSETEEVNIPSIKNRLVFAMSNFNASGNSIRTSKNISSFVKKGTGVYTFTMIQGASSNALVITGAASGGRYFISPEDFASTTKNSFIVYVKRASNETVADRDNCSIVVHYTNTKD